MAEYIDIIMTKNEKHEKCTIEVFAWNSRGKPPKTLQSGCLRRQIKKNF
jgi:hypothetical protein